MRRAPVERGVHLHFFRYSPVRALNVWGYAESLQADVGLRGRALAAAPLARGRGHAGAAAPDSAEPSTKDHRPVTTTVECPATFVVRRPLRSFDLIHAHWVLPNGTPAALVARLRGLPLVISLHGSDVYLAERAAPLSLAAAATFRAAGAVTACSGDLQRARAAPGRARPTASRSSPMASTRRRSSPTREPARWCGPSWACAPDAPLIVTVSRLVYKKGLTYLLEAFRASWRDIRAPCW